MEANASVIDHNDTFETATADDFPGNTNMTNFIETKILQFIIAYPEGIILFGGIIGNLVVLIVYMSKNYSKRAMFVYMRCLAAADIIILATGQLSHWVNYNFYYSGKSVALCKTMAALIFVLFDFGAWIVIAMTFTHVIALTRPHDYKRLCSVKQARIVVATICLCSLIKNSYVIRLAGFSASQDMAAMQCSPVYNKSLLIDLVFIWIDMCIGCVFPFFTLIYCNIRILVSINSAPVTAINSKAEIRFKQITRMLFLVSFCFILFTMPRKLAYIIFFYLPPPITDSREEARFLLLLWTATETWFLNCAVNVWIYCVASKEFRDDFKKIFCRRIPLCAYIQRSTHPLPTV